MTIFSDNSKYNSEIRNANIELLKQNGFTDSGLFSRSGELQILELNTKTNLVFGIRSNIAGRKKIKYFSLCRSFANKDEAIKFFNSMKHKLVKQ